MSNIQRTTYVKLSQTIVLYPFRKKKTIRFWKCVTFETKTSLNWFHQNGRNWNILYYIYKIFILRLCVSIQGVVVYVMCFVKTLINLFKTRVSAYMAYTVLSLK